MMDPGACAASGARSGIAAAAVAWLLGACAADPAAGETRAEVAPSPAGERAEPVGAGPRDGALFPHETLLFEGEAFAPERSGFRAEGGGWSPRGWVLEPATGREAALESPVFDRPAFRELVASWNVDAPPGTGFVVELQVGAAGDARFSPWLELGEWGPVPGRERATSCGGGKVDVDVFRGENAFARFRLRLRAFGEGELRVARLAACVSDAAAVGSGRQAASAPELPPVEIELAPRSQKSEDASIAARICSPTSLAMVLAFHGVDRPTGEVAALAFDARHDLYGNWPRNVQAAYALGVAGYVTRFARWSDVRAELARGRPLVISVRAEEGELAGAPYARTGGHLLVLRGFDARGDCLVLDPAAPGEASVARTYARADVEHVWLAKGGIAYVLLGRER